MIAPLLAVSICLLAGFRHEEINHRGCASSIRYQVATSEGFPVNLSGHVPSYLSDTRPNTIGNEQG